MNDKYSVDATHREHFVHTLEEEIISGSRDLAFTKKAFKFFKIYNLFSKLNPDVYEHLKSTHKEKIIDSPNESVEILLHIFYNKAVAKEFALQIEKALFHNQKKFLEKLSNDGLINLFSCYLQIFHQKKQANTEEDAPKMQTILEDEIVARSEKFTKDEFLKAIQLYELCFQTGYQNEYFFSRLEKGFIPYLDDLVDADIKTLTRALLFAEEISSDFCARFGQTILKNCEKGRYQVPTLYYLSNLVTAPKFKLSSDVVYHLRVEYWNRTAKDIAKSLVNNAAKSDNNDTGVIDTFSSALFEISLLFLDWHYLLLQPLKKLDSEPEQLKNIYKSNAELLQKIANKISTVTDVESLKSITELCGRLKIYELTILQALDDQVAKVIAEKPTELRDIASIISNLLSYRFIPNKAIQDKFMSLLKEGLPTLENNELRTLGRQVIETICTLPSIHSQKERIQDYLKPITQELMSRKCFFDTVEREDLLLWMSFSKYTFNPTFVNYLLGLYKDLYDYDGKKTLHPRRIFVALYRLQKLGKNLEMNNLLKKYYFKGQTITKELGATKKSKIRDSTLQQEVAGTLKSLLKGQKDLKIEEDVFLETHEFDFVITNTQTKQKVLIDVHGRPHYYVNDQSQMIVFDRVKQEFLATMGYKYYIIPYFEWNKAQHFRLEYLREKLKRWNILSKSFLVSP